MEVQDLKYECQFEGCGKRFTTKFSLKRHYYIHSNKKTFECEFCPKVFALPQYLREHQYTHTNQQPFVCGVYGCTESFRQRGKLSLHRRTHDDFQKKEYRILNSDLNKKCKLRSDDFKDQTLKRTFQKSECSQKVDESSQSQIIDLQDKAGELAGNWEPLKKRKVYQTDSQPLEINNASHQRQHLNVLSQNLHQQNQQKDTAFDLLEHLENIIKGTSGSKIKSNEQSKESSTISPKPYVAQNADDKQALLITSITSDKQSQPTLSRQQCAPQESDPFKSFPSKSSLIVPLPQMAITSPVLRSLLGGSQLSTSVPNVSRSGVPLVGTQVPMMMPINPYISPMQSAHFQGQQALIAQQIYQQQQLLALNNQMRIQQLLQQNNLLRSDIIHNNNFITPNQSIGTYFLMNLKQQNQDQKSFSKLSESDSPTNSKQK